jgi:hypothetical protein
MMFMLHQFLVYRYTFLSLLSPFLLRLAGGTGGIWLDITKLLTLRVFLRVFF